MKKNNKKNGLCNAVRANNKRTGGRGSLLKYEGEGDSERRIEGRNEVR